MTDRQKSGWRGDASDGRQGDLTGTGMCGEKLQRGCSCKDGPSTASVLMSIRHQGVRLPIYRVQRSFPPSMGHRPAVIRRSWPARSHIEPCTLPLLDSPEMLLLESSRGRRTRPPLFPFLRFERGCESCRGLLSRGGNASLHAPAQASNWPVPCGEFRFGGPFGNGGIMRPGCRPHFYSANKKRWR